MNGITLIIVLLNQLSTDTRSWFSQR